MDSTRRGLDPELRDRISALIRDELHARRIAISQELATIPPPVPACDVDFNRLLEDRGRIADDLQRLDRMWRSGGSVDEVRAFCEASSSLGEPVRRKIESLLKDAPRH